jgi:hypothetical protein
VNKGQGVRQGTVVRVHCSSARLLQNRASEARNAVSDVWWMESLALWSPRKRSGRQGMMTRERLELVSGAGDNCERWDDFNGGGRKCCVLCRSDIALAAC